MNTDREEERGRCVAVCETQAEMLDKAGAHEQAKGAQLCANVLRLLTPTGENTAPAILPPWVKGWARRWLPVIGEMDCTPWPLHEVLTKLTEASEHLMHDHDCDRHGHELVLAAIDAARSALARIDAPDHSPGPLIVTVQRGGRPTPAERTTALEAERDALRAANATLRADRARVAEALRGLARNAEVKHAAAYYDAANIVERGTEVDRG